MNLPIKISLAHALMGLLTFVVFLQTGWYMRTQEISHLPDAHRMVYRAGHIYFLFSGLLNLSLGVQLQLSAVRWKKVAQYLGSFSLLISPLLFLYGFYIEASLGEINRTITSIGIFLSLGGTALHTMVFMIGLVKVK